MTRRARAVAAVLGLAAVLVAVPAAPAQRLPLPPAQPERAPFLNGTHAFRRILYDVGRRQLTPLREVNEKIDPARTLIVVLGDPAPLKGLDQRLGGLRSFVARGGALLIATDHPTPRELTDAFGLLVDGAFLTLPDGAAGYRGLPDCPYVEPRPDGPVSPFAAGPSALRNEQARRIASNKPSYLHVFPQAGFPVLAYLPRECRNGPRPSRRPWDFAAGGDLSAGRVLVMADHDVFINEMMLQPDNGNIDFALRCADWLLVRPDRQGKRNQVLYYEDGAVQTDFAIPLQDLPLPPLPPPDTLMGMLDEMLPAMEQEGFFAQLEEDDVANGAVENLMAAAPLWEGARPEWKIWTLAAILGSVALGFYAFVRLGTFRHRPGAAEPSLAELVRKQAPAGAVMAQRQEELLRDGNLWEAARDLARQLFVSAGVSPDTRPLPPAVEVRGGWWRRWRARLAWHRLWRLARSARPMRVSPRGFIRLAKQVRALRADLADGTVRIIP